MEFAGPRIAVTPTRDVHVIRLGDLHFRITASTQTDASEPIVLIHGVGMSHRYFRKLHRELDPHGRVLAIDLPGFGGLPKPDRDVDVPAMAAALGEVLDRVGAASVVLVGHSMGAQWVTELAVQRPELVSRVVIMGPVVDTRHRSALRQTIALGIDTLGETPGINATVMRDYIRCGLPWYFTQVGHMLRYRLEARVGELSAPLLVLRGGSDPVAGVRWCRELRDVAPDAVFVTVPRQNHVVQDSAPRAVASAILTFLRHGTRMSGG